MALSAGEHNKLPIVRACGSLAGAMWKWMFRLLKLGVLLLLLVAIVVALAIYYPEKFLCVDSGPVAAEVIVVLGGGADRPLRAAELFQAGAAPRILLSGEGDDAVNRQILLAHGVPAAAITAEVKSTTTHENAVFSVRWLRAQKIQRAIIVTSWYHSRRALKTFQHAAPELSFSSRPSYYAFAHEDWAKTGVGRRLRWEFLKLPGYWVWHGVNPF